MDSFFTVNSEKTVDKWIFVIFLSGYSKEFSFSKPANCKSLIFSSNFSSRPRISSFGSVCRPITSFRSLACAGLSKSWTVSPACSLMAISELAKSHARIAIPLVNVALSNASASNGGNSVWSSSDTWLYRVLKAAGKTVVISRSRSWVIRFTAGQEKVTASSWATELIETSFGSVDSMWMILFCSSYSSISWPTRIVSSSCLFVCRLGSAGFPSGFKSPEIADKQ